MGDTLSPLQSHPNIFYKHEINMINMINMTGGANHQHTHAKGTYMATDH